jgi:hypothetical protein
MVLFVKTVSMRKIHGVVLDGDEEVRKKVAIQIAKIFHLSYEDIYKSDQMKEVKTFFHQGIEIGVIVADKNLKNGQDIRDFLSWLTPKKRGRTIIYSADSNFLLNCGLNFFKIVRKDDGSDAVLKTVLKEIRKQTQR